MKKINLFIYICIFSCVIVACSKNVDGELLLSRVVSKQLGDQLKSKLVDTLQSEGPISAISVCNIDAVKISTAISIRNDLKVGRTSLKIRNPANQPDAWETKQLMWFSSQVESSSDLKSLEIHEVVAENNKEVFRYMKAIPMQEPCILCHGSTLAPSVKESIKNLYPHDQATGFEIGQIRGAFTVKINL